MNILTNSDHFCFCGLVAQVEYQGQYTCNKHINKRPIERVKAQRIRGNSKFQEENGYFSKLTGSNV